MDCDSIVEPTLTKEAFEKQRTTEPLWKLANKGLAERGYEEYPEPPAEQGHLHRPICGNMSGFVRLDNGMDDERNVAIAAIVMEMCTKVPKMASVFGYDQIPLEHGGGPYYGIGQTYSQTPRVYKEHNESTVKGLTQISKSPEQAFDCWFSWFVEGMLPVLFIRLKGGGVVGTADAEDAVHKINKEVVATWERIKHRYPGIKMDASTLSIVPRCASGRDAQTIQMKNATYELSGPQCIIACTGAPQLRPFYQKPDTPAAKKRAAAAGQPPLSLSAIFSGAKLAKDAGLSNPYLPFIDSPEFFGCGDGRGRVRPAIKAIFDEDDQNRSSTGREAKDVSLFQKIDRASSMLTMLQRLTTSMLPDDDDQVSVQSADEQAESDSSSSAKFYEEFNVGLRAYFGAVTAYSATPTTGIYAISKGKNACSEVRTHMVEVRPSNRYIGFKTQHHERTAPWCTKHIIVRHLEDRQNAKRHAMKDMYPYVFQELCGIDIETSGVPVPFTVNGRGCISLTKANAAQPVAGGNGVLAGKVRDTVKRALKGGTKAKQNFWYEDGNNLVRVLEDMETVREPYAREGYRNVLVMSNHTNTADGKLNFVSTVMGLYNSTVTDGACPDHELVRDMILVEWTDKYVRLNWIPGEVDVDVLKSACEEMADDSNLSQHSDYATALQVQEFARNARWALSADDDEAGGEADGEDESEADATIKGESVIFNIPNINYAYSLLWKYKEKMTHKAATRGESFFIKFLLFVGEIGGRGARYKTHDNHQFVLTDMMYSFSVKLNGQITTHAAAAIQAVGRLCTLVADVESTPPITLWTPTACWIYIEDWMNTMNELPLFFSMQKPDESTEELLKRVCLDANGLGCQSLRRMFGGVTGTSSTGTEYYARIDHQLQKGKEVATQMSTACKAVNRVPAPLPIEDHSDEINHRHRQRLSELAAQRQGEIDQIDADDYDEEEEEEKNRVMYAALGAPTIGLRSVAAPTSVKVRRAKPESRKRASPSSSKGKKGTNIFEYNWCNTDFQLARNSLASLRSIRALYPADTPIDQVPTREFVEMWIHRYVYFLHMPHASSGPGAAPDKNEFGHGIRSPLSRKHYSDSILGMLQATARLVFDGFDKLPVNNTDADKKRIATLCKQYATLMNKNEAPGSYGKSSKRSEHEQFVANMRSHLSLWMKLFPMAEVAMTGGMEKWLLTASIPGNDAPEPRGRSVVELAEADEEEFEGPFHGIQELDDDDDDNDDGVDGRESPSLKRVRLG